MSRRARRDAEQPVRERTGRTFPLLDARGATARIHTDIARHLTGELAVDGWSARPSPSPTSMSAACARWAGHVTASPPPGCAGRSAWPSGTSSPPG
ncbi:hypothetical protein [Phytomonospora endophytica]|uniref:Uncharacterized protein n=1 Tax=Phytomonospora endophytica TaxID=714109 RepID=A0A841G3H9_9ACTN|nr:hypothetical protein [Phytomonospora endophytica]MBB6039269.1 hypothetical protein [Phytomonospora endophytica]